MNMFARFFATVESDVVKVIAAFKTDAPLVVADLNKAMDWVIAQTPAIARDLQLATTLAMDVGIATNPNIGLAIAAANEAVTALNAFATASAANKAAGQTDTQAHAAALVQGYVAIKQASAAVSAASIAAATK